MNISLTPELEKFIETEVKSGFYQTASEVIRAGLRRLKDDKPPACPRTLDELENDLLASLSRLNRGEGVNGQEALQRFRQKVKGRVSRG